MPDWPSTSHPSPQQGQWLRGPTLLPPNMALVELALFVAAILATDYALPSFDLASIEPNPCWLPVLLLAVQYGTVSGLLASAVCIALTVWLGFPQQDVGENLFAYLLRAWAQPMMWIAAAVVLGQFRTRHIAERAELTQELGRLSSQRTAIAAYATNLRARCDALERHLAGRDSSEALGLLATLSDVAAGRTGLASAFRSCIGLALPGASASLMMFRGNALEQAAMQGAAPPAASLALDASHPLVQRIRDTRMPFSVLTADGERLLAGKALAAIPIEGSQSGAPSLLGLILLHDMPAELLTERNIAGLPLIAAALSLACEANDDVAAREPASRTIEVSGTPAPPQLLKRLLLPWKKALNGPSSVDPSRPVPRRRVVR